MKRKIYSPNYVYVMYNIYKQIWYNTFVFTLSQPGFRTYHPVQCTVCTVHRDSQLVCEWSLVAMLEAAQGQVVKYDLL